MLNAAPIWLTSRRCRTKVDEVIRVGDEVVVAYPEGDADTGTVLRVEFDCITVRVSYPSRDVIVESIPEFVAKLDAN